MIDNNTLLYLRGDSFEDLSLNPMKTTIEGNCEIVDDRMLFTDNGYIKIETTEKLSGDFTFEWWSNINVLDTINAFVNRTTPNYYLIGHRASNTNYLATWIGTVADNWNIITQHQFNSAIPIGTDNHYAYVRKGSTYYTFFNGKLVSTKTASAVSLGLNGVLIGDSKSMSMWNVRISNVARYTSDFTPITDVPPPVTLLPNDCCLNDVIKR